MSIISMVLVVFVAFLAGLEGILDQFQFHQPLVACTLIGLVTGNLAVGLVHGADAAAKKETSKALNALTSSLSSCKEHVLLSQQHFF